MPVRNNNGVVRRPSSVVSTHWIADDQRPKTDDAVPLWFRKTVWVFDFDGTLVDSMTHFADLASDVIHHHYGTAFAEAREQYRQTSGLPFVEQIARLYPGDARNAAAVAAFETRKAATYFDCPLFPDVRTALHTLRHRDCCVAISSNNAQALVEQYLAAHELPVDIVCGWAPNFAKGRAHFAHIVTITEQTAAEILFIGDSLKDAREAAEHGIDFVGRAGTFTADEFRADYPALPVVRSLTELV